MASASRTGKMEVVSGAALSHVDALVVGAGCCARSRWRRDRASCWIRSPDESGCWNLSTSFRSRPPRAPCRGGEVLCPLRSPGKVRERWVGHVVAVTSLVAVAGRPFATAALHRRSS
jgi:hypothetical protein